MTDNKKHSNRYQKSDNNIIKFNYIRSPSTLSISDQNIATQSSRKYSRNRSYSLTKTQYVQANFKFILSPLIPPTEACLYNPDEYVPWKYVICVILPISRHLTKSMFKNEDNEVCNNMINMENHEDEQSIMNDFLCPICLDQINVPKITSCGHSYCCTCILRHIASEHKSSNKCPVCNEYICKTDLKTVLLASSYPYFQSASFNHNQMFKVNDKIDFTLLEFTKGSLMPRLISRTTSSSSSSSNHKCNTNSSNTMSYNDLENSNSVALTDGISVIYNPSTPPKKNISSSSDKLSISEVIPSALSPSAPYCRLSYVSIDMMREQFLKDREALLNFRQSCLPKHNHHSAIGGDVEALPYIHQALELLASTEKDFELKLVQQCEVSEHIRVLGRQQSYGGDYLESNASSTLVNSIRSNTPNETKTCSNIIKSSSSSSEILMNIDSNPTPNNQQQLLETHEHHHPHQSQLDIQITDNIRNIDESTTVDTVLLSDTITHTVKENANNSTTTACIVKSVKKTPSLTPLSNNNTNINFPVYQFYTGELIFLHPLCMRCFYESISDYNNNNETYNMIENISNRCLPSILQSCRIIDIEYLRVTIANRQRYNILRHIPLHCEVIFIEIDLNYFIPSLISSYIYLKFKDEIDKRYTIRKEKKKQIKRENRLDIDRKIAEDTQLYDQVEYFQQIKLAEELSIQELLTGPSLSIYSSISNNCISNNNNISSSNNIESLDRPSMNQESQLIDRKELINTNSNNNNNNNNRNINNNNFQNKIKSNNNNNSFANITQMGGHYPTLADSIKSSSKVSHASTNTTTNNNSNSNTNNNTNINNNTNTSNATNNNKSSVSGRSPTNFGAWGKIIDTNKTNNEYIQSKTSNNNDNNNETSKTNEGISNKKNKNKIVLMSNTSIRGVYR